MPFSHLTRWLCNGRKARTRLNARLQVETMEDRRTPAASLQSTNFSLTDAANDDSQLVAVASRGRYAILTSTATNVVSGQIDSAGTTDLFWFDTLTGQRKLVTAAAGSNGTIATGQVGQAVISADGLSVAFVSSVNASTYDANYTPASDAGSITNDVFVWNSTTGITKLASVEAANKAIGQSTNSLNPAISGDGNIVAFTSTRPTGLIAATGGVDQLATVDIFRYDQTDDAVIPVSVTPGAEAYGNYGDVTVDPFGRYMDSSGTTFAFISPISGDKVDATFVPTPSTLKSIGDVWQVTVTSATGAPTSQLVSSVAGDLTRTVSSSGGRVTAAIIAPDNPQAVIFAAIAKSGKNNELVNGYLNNNAGQADLYFRLMNSTGGEATILVSAANGSTNLGGNSKLDPAAGSFVVSTDGSRVAFTSASTNLTPTVTDTNNDYDVFTWSYTNRTVLSASVRPDGVNAGNGASTNPSLSSDGKFVAFETNATDLTFASDTNTVSDVIVRDLTTSLSGLASSVPNGSSVGNGRSSNPELIGAGAAAAVVFNSFSTNLDPLFPSTTFGDQFVFSVGVPISNNSASRVGVVSGTRFASASFVSFANDGSILVGDKFTPFPGFSGEVRVATGDVDGDGTLDLIAGTGPGGGPRIVVISGATGSVIRNFFAYEPTYRGGVYVAAGDFNGDGKADVVVGTDQGGGPRVRILSEGNVGTPIADFFVYEATFYGGVRVAVGDVNGDGRDDLITGAGFGGGPRVTVFNGKTLGTTNVRLADFFAFENSLRNGVNVSGGDVNGDGKADLGIGAGPGGGPRVTVFSGASVITGTPAPTQLLNFFAFDSTQRYGVRVAIKNIDGDATGDLMTAPGVGGQNRIRTFSGGKFGANGGPGLIDDLLLYGDAGSRLGAWVG
jgi:hypothetical protein